MLNVIKGECRARENIGLEALGVKLDRGHVVTDKHGRTNVAGLYAIGDVAGAPWLAHKASHEGIHCIEHLAGLPQIHLDSPVPGCTYSVPQIASVGMTEAQAKKDDFLQQFLPFLRQWRSEQKSMIICGDWNIAHKEIDLKNWKGNLKNSGFLPHERAWLDTLYQELGYVDAYRQLYPQEEAQAYTWWSNRGRAWENNVGWRIDYQVASPDFSNKITQAVVYKDSRFSDHAPLIIDYR